VALRWLIEQDGILAIPGAKNGRQAASNAEALSFTLVAADPGMVMIAADRRR
jgi:diketogulonate reductase-like aldo/keto reductase